MDSNLRKMANKMGVLKAYNQNCHKNIRITFDAMLEDWYQEKVFQLNPSDAKTELVKVLEESYCSNRVVTTIRELFLSY